MISEWEKHTLLADTALQLDDPVRSILHYQQALSLSEDISECVEIEADERLFDFCNLLSQPRAILALGW